MALTFSLESLRKELQVVLTSDEDEENYYQTGMVYVPREEDLEYKEDRGPLDLTRRIEELEKELAIQKERAQAAELETSLVKGTGMNSPEMLNAKKKIQELEDLIRSRDYTKAHDYKFLVEENKKLHKQIDNLIRAEEKRITKTREAGF